MRKYLFVLALFLSVIITGCTNRNTPPDTDDVPVKVQVMEMPDELTLEETEPFTVDEEVAPKETSPTSAPESEPQNTPSESPVVSENKQPQKPITTTEPSQTPTPSDELPSDMDVVPETPVQEVPEVPNATADDADAIADLVVKYINDYRTAEGTPAAINLPGLTEYAKYRSRQIISDFSHNTYDERAAATALSYGMYVEPALYGMNGEPYYTACAGEAIAKAGYVGTIDYIAKSLASLVRNSSKHWVYVGDADYKYIAVGITFESGMWYCDVALTRENYG